MVIPVHLPGDPQIQKADPAWIILHFVPCCASPAWSGGTVGKFLSIQLLMLFWGTTLSNCLGHQMPVPPPSRACPGWAWKKVLPCSWRCLRTPQISCDSCQHDKKNPSQALLAATRVGALWEMNKWFVRSLPLSCLGITEVSRLVSHTWGSSFCCFLVLQENKI